MILNSERLSFRKVNFEDAPFIADLVQEPDYIQNIRNTGVTNLEQAQSFIADRFLSSYANGMGLYLIINKRTSEPMGICGFVKRNGLPQVDLGYALHSRYRGQGFAFEAAKYFVQYGQSQLKLSFLLAITKPDNQASQKLLLKLGFEQKGLITLPDIPGESALFQLNFSV